MPSNAPLLLRKPPGRAEKPEVLFFVKSLPIAPAPEADFQPKVAAKDLAILLAVVVPS